jgi:predicted metalloprotease
MRLDDFDPNSVNVEDQRGGRLPIGMRGGSIGCGTLVIALIAAVVFGVDPGQMIGGLEQVQQQAQQPDSSAGTGGKTASESCSVDEGSRETCNALSSLNKTWQPIFAAIERRLHAAQAGVLFAARPIGLRRGAKRDGSVLLPQRQRHLHRHRFLSRDGPASWAPAAISPAPMSSRTNMATISRPLTGLSDQVRSAQSAKPARRQCQLQVRMELQADCYAGVWAARNKDRIEAGDIEEGLNAAHQIGDDTLMKSAGRRPVEEAFTHGSSAQRMQWLRKGLESGNEDDCDTFADLRR